MVSTNRERSPFPVAPVGALCVCSAAERAGHEVDFLDMMFVRDPVKSLKAAVNSSDYKAIGFSIRNLDDCISTTRRSYFADVKEMVESVLHMTDSPVILGGSGFSIAPEGWFRRLNADFGVAGDGEIAFVELINALASKQSPAGIAGILINNGSINDSKRKLTHSPVTDLDNVYSPSHDKCSYRQYLRRGGFVSVQTKRGCSFKCIYCVYPVLEGTAYKLRSPESIANEIETLARNKTSSSFYFTDSVFNTPREHAISVCKELARRKLSIKWMAYCNPVGFDLNLARAMTEAGCVGVEFGLDVATGKMLKKMGKPFTQSDIRYSLKSASDAGLPFALHFLFGGPGECPDDIRETQRFIDSCAAPNAVFALMGIRIYKNTPIEKTALAEGMITEDTDLFDPAYYISRELGKNPMMMLDEVARLNDVWSTPTDWSRLTMKVIQQLVNRMGDHPQWLNIQNYGKYLRR